MVQSLGGGIGTPVSDGGWAPSSSILATGEGGGVVEEEEGAGMPIEEGAYCRGQGRQSPVAV